MIFIEIFFQNKKVKTIQRAMIKRHKAVMPKEILYVLEGRNFNKNVSLKNKCIVDGTLGDGGHSELILQKKANVIGIDQDQVSLKRASENLLPNYSDNFQSVESNFSEIDSVLKNLDIDKVDGIILDLGLSSMQISDNSRGFSFQEDGNLDMRMGQNIKHDAKYYLNNLDKEEINDILWKFGQETQSRKISQEIINFRNENEFSTSEDLTSVVKKVYKFNKTKKGKNPATRTFQAIRIYVNKELLNLEIVLPKAFKSLKSGGIIAIISYHSLEDRIVKNMLKKYSQEWLNEPNMPEPVKNPDCLLKLPKQKFILPSEEEIKTNPRSRSAKLRSAIKL